MKRSIPTAFVLATVWVLGSATIWLLTPFALDMSVMLGAVATLIALILTLILERIWSNGRQTETED